MKAQSRRSSIFFFLPLSLHSLSFRCTCFFSFSLALLVACLLVFSSSSFFFFLSLPLFHHLEGLPSPTRQRTRILRGRLGPSTADGGLDAAQVKRRREKEREDREEFRSSKITLSTSPLSPLSTVSKNKNRNTAAGLFVGVAAGAGAGYLLFSDRNSSDESDPSALALRRRRRLLSLPLAPGAAGSRHPALQHGCPPADLLREFPGFAVGWDARLRVPRWVAESVTRRGSRGDGDRSAHVFREDDGGGGNGSKSRRRNNKNSVYTTAENNDSDDPGIDPRWRSTNDHYWGSGYDRGHCAPAADFKGDPKALEATFVLSNIAPQVGPGMNRDYWARFERFVKTLATAGNGGDEESEGEKEVVVFTGPLYLPQRIKNSDKRDSSPNAPRYEMRHPMLGDPPRLVAVPTHFFKVALVLEKKKEWKKWGGGGKSGDGGGEGDGGSGGSGSGESSKNGGTGGGTARAIGAWVMPNAPIPPETPLTAFCVPLSSLEDAAGGRFFQGVFDEEVSSSLASENLDRAALRWQARGRAAALDSSSRNRRSVQATAEAAAALLPLAPKLAGLLTGGGGGGEKGKVEGGNEEERNDNDDSEHAGPSSPSRSLGGAAELLLNPAPPSGKQQKAGGRGGGGKNGNSSSSGRRGSSRAPPPEPAPKWSWLFQHARGGRKGGSSLSHICDVTECKLPAEDWYKSGPPAAAGGATAKK